MKFHVFIDDVLLQKKNGSTEIKPKDIYKMDTLTGTEENLIIEDMYMIETFNTKPSIHLACEMRHFRDLSNRNIRVERVEETK